MTILCPAEFAEAVRFAAQADQALEAAIWHAKDKDARQALEAKRGQGTRTLLACFGHRAYSDDMDNKNPHLPDGSEVQFQDGERRTVYDLGNDRRPLRETFIYRDIAQHYFFFREEWIDPYTRQRVEIFDRCWYIFRDGTTQEQVNNMDGPALEEATRDQERKVERTYRSFDAEAAAADNIPLREVMRRRVGMCGGIIYHADWRDGQRTDYGSWSTHT